MITKQIPMNFTLDFSQGKQFNERQVDNWFRNINNPDESNKNLKSNILRMLESFEYSYGKYLSDVADIFRCKDAVDEK
jgi:hypothetical protein